MSGVALADNNPIDTAYGIEVTVDDTYITEMDMHVSPVSGVLTIAGSPAADEICYFDAARVVGDANDTRAQDANLLGIKLFYTITTVDDT